MLRSNVSFSDQPLGPRHLRTSPDLLAPLTAAADLPNHPTLSRPFYSKTLTELTEHAMDMVQKEKASLWKMKHLLTKLSGDHTWVPCEMMETRDDAFFDDGQTTYVEHPPERLRTNEDADLPVDKAEVATNAKPGEVLDVKEPQLEANSVEAGSGEAADGPSSEDDIAMINAPKDVTVPDSLATSHKDILEEQKLDDEDSTISVAVNNDKRCNTDENHTEKAPEAPTGTSTEVAKTGETVSGPDPELTEAPEKAMDIDQAPQEDEDAALNEQEDIPAPHRMRTRAQAQAASDNTNNSHVRSMTPESSKELDIHPYFLAPANSHPDRDLGLPGGEAEELRRIVQLYIHKQEEVCRGAEKLLENLLKADRMRQTVMRWAKAEGHLGEMSDGEDWYDKDEYGLEEDLKKGQDEEEEDAATTAKKTRTRRQ